MNSSLILSHPLLVPKFCNVEWVTKNTLYLDTSVIPFNILWIPTDPLITNTSLF
nr:MAG TPA: hypothetical protein [Caudoviricetes sp.]